MLGILLIDKPLGITSHDAVQAMRRRFSSKRVGHAGTLDPAATGLLVVAVGPATRFLQYLPLEPKVYEAEVRFGSATTTYDREGEVTDEAAIPDSLAERIAAELPAFTGPIAQLPPMHSAVKKDGKALYHYARAGIEVERRLRHVHISSFDVRQVDDGLLTCRIVCSGGTYIRSLAHDLGQAVGCGAFLAGLRRTDVGKFSVEKSCSLDEAGPEHLIPLREALSPLPVVELNAVQVAHVRDGRWVDAGEGLDGRYAGLLDLNGDVFSVARIEDRRLYPECVIGGGVG